MKLILYFIGGIVLANIVAATFFWRPPTGASNQLVPVASSATQQGQDPWMANERYNAPGREHVRKGMLETLDKPWASYCTEDGHKKLIQAIDNYYYQRSAQAWSYGNTYGEAARRYAIEAWATTDDNRIERLMSETYGRGYFSLDELRPSTRVPLAQLVKGAHVSANPCAS